MKVESLKTAPDRAGRYWVTFDDGSKMGLYRQTVEDFALYSGKESVLRVVGERSAKCVTHIIAESSDAVQTGCVGFYGKLVLRIGTRSCAPTLTIYIYRWVDLVHGSTYLVHRLYVMDAHKVEAESVNVEFVYPVLDALYHKLAHQRTL